MSTPAHARYLIVGAGIHGLSTAWHLARELTGARRRQRRGHPGHRQDRRRGGRVGHRLRHDPQQLLPARHARAHGAQRVGVGIRPGRVLLPSGRLPANRARSHARRRGADLRRAAGDRVRLRPGRGRSGTAWPTCWTCSPTGRRPARPRSCTRSRAGTPTTGARWTAWRPRPGPLGVRIEPGIRVTGLRLSGGAVTAVETDRGTIACDQLVVAAGPWVRDLWAMLGLPDHIDVTGPDGTVHPGRPMWTYWALQEGTLEVDPGTFTTSDGGFPPVVHVDSDVPLYDDIDGSLITDAMWGIYFKPDFCFGGVQGGSAPYIVDRPAARGRGRPVRHRQPRVRRRRGLHPDVDLRARALPQAVREAAPPVPQGTLRAASARSPRTASPSSTPSARTPT